MNADLGARLLAAGLVTREELGLALSSVPAHGGALAAELVRRGVEEEALLGFFVADGFGPVVDLEDLARAEGDARVPPQLAVDMLALPLRRSASGLVVAMADPSDVHAVRELRQKVGVEILPAVAPIRALESTLQERFPEESARARGRWAARSEEPEPIALIRRRDTPSGSTIEDSFDSIVPLSPAGEPRASVFPQEGGPQRRRRDTADFETADPRRKKRITARFDAPREEPDETSVAELEPPVRDTRPDGPGRETLDRVAKVVTESEPGDGGGWGELERPSRRDGIARRAARAHSILPQRLPAAEPVELGWETAPREAGDLSAILATIRAAKTKNDVILHACRGLSPLGRCALILVLSRGILKGREVVGGDLPRDAVLNLWIPATSRSLLARVLETGEPYLGPYGGSSADAVFRAALGSRGGDVLLMPVVLSGKAIAVLALDEPVADAVVLLERAEVVARATAEAFRRLIAVAKSPSRS